MSRSNRITLLVFLFASGAPACATKDSVPTCAASSDCPASARCIGQECMENAPPVASVALPSGPLTANALVAFDGSGSSDPDPGDSVTSWAWTFRAVSAPCAAPTVAGTGATAQVRFACPGAYAVDLTVEDELSAAGVATVPFDVVPHDGPALVESGPDMSVAHACTGAPLLCTTAPEIPPLSAWAPGSTSPVMFEWTVRPPPDLELGPNRRVTFDPDRFAASPKVAIETDGIAISGDWILEVVARDEAGVLGTAVTRVSIGNRPPVVEAVVPTPDHVFDGTHFRASGEVAVSVTDPDGDPMPFRETKWHHWGDGEASLFAGEDLGTRITFGIVVPYSSPGDGALLIGGAGLERSMELGVQDVNGALTHVVWPIAVGNRPPVLISSPAPFAVDHSYDAAESAYEAVASLSAWWDPDGDPLMQGGPTGDGACASIAVAASRAAATCRVPFAGVSALAGLVGTHVVNQQIGDPWAQAPETAVTFQILNRPPVLASTSPVVLDRECSNITCCSLDGGACDRQGGMFPAGTASVPSAFDDPDGDPIDAQASGANGITPMQPFVCTPPGCDFPLSLAETSVCGTITTLIPTAISDGVASANGTIAISRTCP